MSLTQIKRILKIRRMNQIPIYNLYTLEPNMENISEVIEKEYITEIVQSILYDMINSIETNHNFEIVNAVEIPNKKNVFKRLFSATKKLIYR